jgi:hypothetical protein
MTMEAQLLDPRTSLHGVPESCHDYGDLTDRANMASECMVEDVLSKQLYDQGQEAWLPMEYIGFVYDVGTHGGAVGAQYIDCEIPIGTIVIGGIAIVADKFVAASGTPTLTIDCVATGDIFTSSDICAESVNAKIAVVPLFANAATWLVSTNALISATVGSADLTAGRLYGYLMCFRNVAGNARSSGSSSSSASSSSSSSSSSMSNSSSSSSSSDRLRF